MNSISPLVNPTYHLMSARDPVSSSSNASTGSSASSAASSAEVVNKDQFLKLLVAQLQNQDPLNPLQGDAFVAQLATFSSLEQLVSINETIKKLVGAVDTAS